MYKPSLGAGGMIPRPAPRFLPGRRAIPPCIDALVRQLRFTPIAWFLMTAALVTLPGATPPGSETPVTVDAGGGVQLSGTLMTPSGRGLFPVALIIAGSGPTDRDGNGSLMSTNAYKLLAAALAARGIATLRYDKRGIGSSHTPQHMADVRLEDFVDDAVALTHYLEATKRFGSVSIVGHSEGSLIGMIAAQRDPNVKSLVSLEGAGRPAPMLIEEQLHASGISPAMASDPTLPLDPQVVSAIADFLRAQ